MNELKNSGLQLYMQEGTNRIALLAPLQYDAYAIKNVDQMMNLLRNAAGLNPDERFYDVYRGIRLPEDQALLESRDYRYDITVIMDGTVNGECKKTSGHYHGYNPTRTNTYAEVYEVIEGRALYVLQRADNFDTDPQQVKISDLIFAVVEAGQAIIIPPNYGHCSINVGEGPLVFSNLAYAPCPVAYDSVKHYHGMSWYIMREEGKISAVPNPNYQDVPAPRFAKIRENPHLGIQFGHPVYNAYRENPQAFDFLGNPDPYVDEIMSMLDFKTTLEDILK